MEGVASENRLHVRDRASGQLFLIDTGADISLLPANPKIVVKPSGRRLFAANESRIDTFGESLRELDLGLRRAFRWNLCIAAVPYAIIGADLKKRRLIDTATRMYSPAVSRSVPPSSVNSVIRARSLQNFSRSFRRSRERLNYPHRERGTCSIIS